jgi:hypothetical protein
MVASMDQSLTRSGAIDFSDVLWMPLPYLPKTVGSPLSSWQLLKLSTKFKPKPTLEPDEDEELTEPRLQMVAGLARVMVWIMGISTADDNKRILRARFLRMIVVLWLIDPHHFGCASQASMARQYRFDKQSFNNAVASFRKHVDYTDVRFRSPTAVAHMRKPSRE